jgi:competence protein ComFC
MIQINGPWKDGYAFDIHTIESIFTGNNEYGHATFDTKRSLMGQCLYELKYGQHLPVLEKIVDLIIKDGSFRKFINNIDIILPVPPSNKYRRIQPVLVCSKEISVKFNKELRSDVLSSANKEELKNIATQVKYAKIKEALKVDERLDKSKNILIFDDVFDSGSTLSAITNALYEKGYLNIFVFTLTKTKKAD